MYTPSDLFGSLISDTEHLFDELHSHRASARNVHGSPTPSLSPTHEYKGGPMRTSVDTQTSNKPTVNATTNVTNQLERFASRS